MVMAANGGRETCTGENEPWRAREDGWTDGGKPGEAGGVRAMDQSLVMQQAQQTLFDQLPEMQL